MAALVMQVKGFQFQGKVLRQFCAIFRAKQAKMPKDGT